MNMMVICVKFGSQYANRHSMLEDCQPAKWPKGFVYRFIVQLDRTLSVETLALFSGAQSGEQWVPQCYLLTSCIQIPHSVVLAPE